MSESLKSLASLLERSGLTPMMAGGWAVNHHGFSRSTLDIDLVYDTSRRDEIISALATAGYYPQLDLSFACRMLHKTMAMPILDVIWVDSDTFKTLLDEAEPFGVAPALRVISLKSLMSMKLHALHDDEPREGRDRRDILELLSRHPYLKKSKEFHELVRQQAPKLFWPLLGVESDS
ncbi:MAG: nucleotidyl transferase AbiEii/AbiGii toxin family protein [Akkermansiaceae bacterium]|nr:nucleotidyl transferase AbiEii/AbiGii toxin family protein [Akkermansiaceae bacterium]